MSKYVRYIVGAVITAIVLFVVWYFGNVVAYILISAVLAIVGKPLTNQLAKLHIRKKRLPRWIAALTTMVVIWLVIISIFWIFVPAIFNKFNELATLDFQEFIKAFREPLQTVENFIEKTFSVRPGEFSLVDSIYHQITPLVSISTVNNVISSLVWAVSSILIAAFSISFITFFFLKEEDLFSSMVIALFPKRYEGNITRALESITLLLKRYFTGILIESTVMTILVSLGLLIFGFQPRDSLIIGLFVGIFNVIPYVGPIIGMVLGLFFGLAGTTPDASLMGLCLRIAGTILVAQAIDNNILQPVLYSKSAKAHPLEIFLVILIAGSMAGILGMLLAIPAYNVVRVFGKEFFNHFRVVQKLTEGI